jgi:hypothetical protein
VEELGLPTVGQAMVELARDHPGECQLVGPVGIIAGDGPAARSAEVRAIVGPAGRQPTLGRLVLQVTGLLVDCERKLLVPDPRSPDRPRYLMTRACGTRAVART